MPSRSLLHWGDWSPTSVVPATRRATPARRVTATLVAAYLAVVAFRATLVRVHGPSMMPTFRPGDLLLTLPARWRPLRPGTVVVLRDPADATHLIVKRVASVDGGRVDVRGDNPDASTDSRHWGPVARTEVTRVVITRLGATRSR